MKNLLIILFSLATLFSKAQVSEARKLLLSGSDLDLDFQVYETQTADADSFNVISINNDAYIMTGIKYYDTYSTVIDPPVDATGTKNFVSYPADSIIYFRFMNNSPYYSVWASGVDNPDSEDTITIYTDLQFSEAKTIHVGLIGDNYFSMRLNSELLVNTEDKTEVRNFRYLNIFPVDVESGNSRFTFSGIGDGKDTQALGVIIWDNTKDELYTNPVSRNNWDVLWSSNDAINSVVYNCPSAEYNYEDAVGRCVKLSNISNWASGDTVYVSMFVPEDDQSNVNSWSLKVDGSTIDSGTSYEPNTIATGMSSGSNKVEYTVTLSTGGTQKIIKSVSL